MNDFRQNADLRNLAINRRAEAALDFLLAVAIGLSMGLGAFFYLSR